MAQLEAYSYEPVAPAGKSGIEQILAQSNRFFQETNEAHQRYQETGSILGCRYKYPTADSYAYYRVTSERPLRVQHVAIMDAWALPDAHIRGLRREDIEESVRRELALSGLLSQLSG